MTIDDRFGTTQAGVTPGTAGVRSAEYDDGLTVQDTTHGVAGMPGAGRVGSASDPAGGYSETARDLGRDRDGAGDDRGEALTADESGTLIAADKVIGTAVYDAAGERLGTIDSIMLNKRSGKVAYAVMSFGGFLGIGERYHPLPWNVLTYDHDKGGYNVEHSADDLRKAPNYSRNEVDTLDYARSGGEIDNYYGVDVGRASYNEEGAGNTTRPTFTDRGVAGAGSHAYDEPGAGNTTRPAFTGSETVVSDSRGYDEPGAGNTTRPAFDRSTGIEAADAIGSTTGAGSSGMGSTGMGSNRNL